MTVTIKRSDSPEEIDRKIEKVIRAARNKKLKKTFDPHKYLGKRIFKGIDGLEYQKKMRDEWEQKAIS